MMSKCFHFHVKLISFRVTCWLIGEDEVLLAQVGMDIQRALHCAQDPTFPFRFQFVDTARKYRATLWAQQQQERLFEVGVAKRNKLYHTGNLFWTHISMRTVNKHTIIGYLNNAIKNLKKTRACIRMEWSYQQMKHCKQ